MSSSAHLRSLWALAHPAPAGQTIPAHVPLLVCTPTGTVMDALRGLDHPVHDHDGYLHRTLRPLPAPPVQPVQPAPQAGPQKIR
ncbi:hypothetical protein [Acidipropionibacterium jensenii]|uniref:hypothetical protein n=1 Tax=Acidipropionibacterium jensenii TaxID=1749 RepID=UPI00214B3DCC|nr:hypothetical protein [Acidipropionibacterium jensenii]